MVGSWALGYWPYLRCDCGWRAVVPSYLIIHTNLLVSLVGTRVGGNIFPSCNAILGQSFCCVVLSSVASKCTKNMKYFVDTCSNP